MVGEQVVERWLSVWTDRVWIPVPPPQMLSTYSRWALGIFLISTVRETRWLPTSYLFPIPSIVSNQLWKNCNSKNVMSKSKNRSWMAHFWKKEEKNSSIWGSPLCCTSLRSRTSCRRPSSWPRGASCSSPPISCSQTFGARGRNRTKKFRRCLNIGNWNWRKLSWSMESVTLSWDMRLFHLTLIYISKCVVSLLSLWHMAKMQISR